MTPRKIARAVGATLGLALALAVSTSVAQTTEEAPDTVHARGGVTKLKLGAQAKRVLRRAGVRVSRREFPVTGRELDPTDGNPADLTHTGRLVFRAGRDRIGFGQLNVDIDAQGRLFGTTAGQVVPIANLTGGTLFRQGLHSTDINGLRARLTRAAARALNRALETRRFRRGLVLGSLSVDAQLEEALIDSAGQTDLQIVPEAAEKLQQAGVSATAIPPGTVTVGAGGLPLFAVPIIGGRMELDQSQATVLHDGGLLLSQQSSGRQLALSRPAVELSTPPVLSFNFGGARAPAADLDLSGMTKSGTARGIEIGGVVVRLNASSAALLNATFSPDSPVFAAGDAFATASSSITFK